MSNHKETLAKFRRVQKLVKNVPPTIACKQEGIHPMTYKRWLVAHGTKALLRRVLNSNLSPMDKLDIQRRLTL